MAFVTKTWKDRLVEYAGRRKIKNVATGAETLVDVSRSEGTVSQAGDAFSAANMNNLEQRIKNEFDNVNSSLVSDIYVGDDKKLHKVIGGADTVLNFSGSASYPEFTLYSNSNIVIPVKGNTLSFDMQTPHPYVVFYVEKRVNGVYTNLFTKNAGETISGTKSFDISDSDAIQFRTVAYSTNYGNSGRVAISNIKVS